MSEKQALELLLSHITIEDVSCYLLLLPADAPLLNRSLTEQITKKHLQYGADFTYAEAYPAGLVPTVIRLKALRKLSELVSEKKLFTSFETLFKRHLTDFHIESLVAPFIWRYRRFSLLANNRLNIHLLESLIKEGATSENNPLDIVEKQPQILRSLPASLHIQLQSVGKTGCLYQPAEQPTQVAISKNIWQKIVLQLEDVNPEAVIHILPFGEATEHPQFFELLSWLFDHTSFKVVLETQAQGISQAVLKQLCTLKKLHWIILLDSLDAQLYRKIHTAELQAVLQVIEQLQKEGISCYAQALRMRITEPFLTNFQNYWKERNLPVIIQKYNDFAGLIAQRRVVDLQPWKRIPCFRLQRELIFDAQGRAFLCLQDLYHQHYPLGDITQKNIAHIWQQGSKFYEQHCQHDYPELCKKCDEYYNWSY